MKQGYIVDINDGLFRDRIISLKPNVEDAVKDGLKWYRKAAADPIDNPAVTATPSMVFTK